MANGNIIPNLGESSTNGLGAVNAHPTKFGTQVADEDRRRISPEVRDGLRSSQDDSSERRDPRNEDKEIKWRIIPNG